MKTRRNRSTPALPGFDLPPRVKDTSPSSRKVLVPADRLAAAIAPIAETMARLNARTAVEPVVIADVLDDREARALEQVPMASNLALSLRCVDGAWSVEAAPTSWDGAAQVHVVWRDEDHCGTALTPGTGAWFMETLHAVGAAATVARVNAWLTRYEGPVASMRAQSIEVVVDGAVVLRLRPDGDGWRTMDDESARVALAASLAPEIDAGRADEIDTVHAARAQALRALPGKLGGRTLTREDLSREGPPRPDAPTVRRDDVATPPPTAPPRARRGRLDDATAPRGGAP